MYTLVPTVYATVLFRYFYYLLNKKGMEKFSIIKHALNFKMNI